MKESSVPSSFFSNKMSNQQLFVILAIGSWAMLFGTLVLSLGLARVRSATWPPVDSIPLDPLLPTASTLLLFASSFLIHKGYTAYKNLDLKNFKFFWGLGCLSGFFFLAFQALSLGQWWQEGMRVEMNLYTSTVYVFILFHAIHVLVALLGLSFKYKNAKSLTSLQLWAWFWHFIDIVWIISFPILLF